jgi:hypothetical protein
MFVFIVLDCGRDRVGLGAKTWEGHSSVCRIKSGKFWLPVWCRRGLYIHRVPEITDTFLVCVLVHPTKVYRDGTSGNVDLQLAYVRHPGSPTIPPILTVSVTGRTKRVTDLRRGAIEIRAFADQPGTLVLVRRSVVDPQSLSVVDLLPPIVIYDRIGWVETFRVGWDGEPSEVHVV